MVSLSPAPACRAPAPRLARRWGLALSLFLLAQLALGAEISARLSRNPVGLEDSFQLILESAGEKDLEPDWSPLEKDFEILQRSQSQSIQIVNGDMSRKTTWQLTLMARRAGELRIPPVRFGSQSSPELLLSVRDAPRASPGDAGELFIEVEVSPKTLYVQAQLVYTLRLFVADTLGDVRLRQLTAPRPQGVEAVVETLGEDRQYQTRRGGRNFTVLERRYALFPQHSGSLVLPPVLFEGEVGGRRAAPFDLFDSPFGKPGQVRRVRSQELSVQVQPIPGEIPAGPWLPADNLQVVENWSRDPAQFAVGEPLTWTLAIIADGLTAAQLPSLAERLPLPDGLKAYPDQPELRNQTADSGITGSRQEKLAVMANRPGRYQLPGLRLGWWNTRTGKLEYAELASRVIEVQGPAPTRVPAPVAAPATLPAEVPGRSGTAPPDVPSASPTPAPLFLLGIDPTLWPWIGLLLALGWAITGLAWWWTARRRSVTAKGVTTTSSRRTASAAAARRRLERAISGHDRTGARHALLDWAQAVWPTAPPRSLGELARRLGGESAVAIGGLDRALYGLGSDDTWGTPALCAALATAARAAGVSGPVARDAPIAPLNPWPVAATGDSRQG
jgi:hypothetical protein